MASLALLLRAARIYGKGASRAHRRRDPGIHANGESTTL
jgi:hypothetical protein